MHLSTLSGFKCYDIANPWNYFQYIKLSQNEPSIHGNFVLNTALTAFNMIVINTFSIQQIDMEMYSMHHDKSCNDIVFHQDQTYCHQYITTSIQCY